MKLSMLGLSMLLVAVTPACKKSDGDKSKKPAAGKAATVEANLGTFKMQVPAAWKSEPVTSSMRKAQYTVADGTKLVVYYFGKGGAGGVQANLDRWLGQIKQPDGKPSKDAATIQTKTIGGLQVTTVDVSGHYVAAMRPGMPAKNDMPGSRMLAAIVVASDGPYYFKLVGKAPTIAAAKAGFDQLVASLTTAK